MTKYVKLFITAADETAGYNLIATEGIVELIQASTSTVTIKYNNANAAVDILTITHDAIAANAHTMRDYVMDQIENALRTSWQQPFYTADSTLPDNAAGTAPVTITAIAVA